jgi:hypothetical protein
MEPVDELARLRRVNLDESLALLSAEAAVTHRYLFCLLFKPLYYD